MNDDYSYALNVGFYVYFGGIGIFVLITFICAMRWYARQAREFRIRAEEAERERAEATKPKPKRKVDEKPKPARKPVVFVDAEEDDEDEAPKPAGKHVYDPKQHKVVWVPAE